MYLKQVEVFITANSIADYKVVVFLSGIGGKTYSLLKDLLAPEKGSGQVAVSLVQKAEGTLQTQAVGHRRKILL